MKRGLRPILIGVVILASCILVSVTLTALVFDALFTDIPESATNLPVYPNAQEVSVRDGFDGAKFVTFVTADDPTEVLAFYSRVLKEDGWFNPLFAPEYKYEWHQAGLDGPTGTAFSLTISSTPLPQGGTQVQVRVFRFDPR